MKNRISEKFGLLAVIAGLIAGGSVYGQSAKGGGAKLLELSGKAKAQATEKAHSPKVTCPECKSEPRVVQERENKARVVRLIQVSSHDCRGCSTTGTVSGHGKAKVEKRVHTCSIAGEKSVCCSL